MLNVLYIPNVMSNWFRYWWQAYECKNEVMILYVFRSELLENESRPLCSLDYYFDPETSAMVSAKG